MKNIIIFVIIILSGYQVSEAQNVNVRSWDTKLKTNVLTGPCTRQVFLENEFGKTYKSEYDTYKPVKQVISKLKKDIGNIDIVLVFGEWCGDSQEQVPRFMKVIDQAGMSMDRLNIIAVNRDKKAVVEDIDKYNIERVPTFIVYNNGVEVGRIVETPANSLEEDLWSIVKKDSSSNKK